MFIICIEKIMFFLKKLLQIYCLIVINSYVHRKQKNILNNLLIIVDLKIWRSDVIMSRKFVLKFSSTYTLSDVIQTKKTIGIFVHLIYFLLAI